MFLAGDGRTFEEIAAARLGGPAAPASPPTPAPAPAPAPALLTESEGEDDWVALAEGRFTSIEGAQR